MQAFSFLRMIQILPREEGPLLRHLSSLREFPCVLFAFVPNHCVFLSIKRSGIKGLPSVINAALLTSAWSAASSDLYTSSRAICKYIPRV